MKHLLIILSILLLSSFLVSCEKKVGDNNKVETLYAWGTLYSVSEVKSSYWRSNYTGYDWREYGEKDTQGVYEGEVKKRYTFFGKLEPHGFGNLSFSDGEKYVGEWKNGHKHGQGTQYISPDSILLRCCSLAPEHWDLAVVKYEGGWKMGEKHGQGTSTWKNGDKYVGEYKNNHKWKGKIITKYGKIITQWKNGEIISGNGPSYE